MKNVLDTCVASAVMGMPLAVFMFGAIVGSLWAMLLGISCILAVADAVEFLVD